MKGSALATAVIAAGLLVAVGRDSPLAQTQRTWRTVTVEGRTISEQDLLTKNAPVFIQWLAKDWDQLDRFWALDFTMTTPMPLDRWSATGRWDFSNKPKASGSPKVYGALLASTRKQAYLAYYYYHPRDYSTFSVLKTLAYVAGFIIDAPLNHENDLEGGVLVVQLDGSPHTHAFALAHDKWSERDGTTRSANGFDRCETAVAVEAGKHGAHLVRDPTVVAEEPKTFHSFFRGWVTVDHPVVYTAAGSECHWPTSFAKETYEVLPLDSFYDTTAFAAKTHSFFAEKGTIVVQGGHPATALTRFDVFKALGGKNGPRAHWPWGQLKGDFDFYDPVSWILRQLPDYEHKCEIDIDYQATPYLDRHVSSANRQRVLEGLRTRAASLRPPGCRGPGTVSDPPPGPRPSPHDPPPVEQAELDVELDPVVVMPAPGSLTLEPLVTTRRLDPSEVTLTWKTDYSTSWSGLDERQGARVNAPFGPGTHQVILTGRARNLEVSRTTTIDVGDFPAISFAFGNADPLDESDRSVAATSLARRLRTDTVGRNRSTIDLVREMLISEPALAITLNGRSDRWGSEQLNYTLRQRRTRSVRDLILASGGIDPERVRIVPRGGTGDRVCEDTNDECDAMNRHVQVAVAQSLPR